MNEGSLCDWANSSDNPTKETSNPLIFEALSLVYCKSLNPIKFLHLHCGVANYLQSSYRYSSHFRIVDICHTVEVTGSSANIYKILKYKFVKQKHIYFYLKHHFTFVNFD